MQVYFGVDYYPEHWPKSRWATDAKLMQEMGMDMVRMAEFSWSKLEPSKGAFNFGWLDEAIELLAAHGIKTILGTPSAAPPPWIIKENPEIQPIDSLGRVRHLGGRHHDCQSGAAYREHIRRYVTAFAGHFGSNPNVIGWQVDNELGNSHGDLCMCPSCEAGFRGWLREKYGDIATLNEKWGTTFWSQDYGSFDEIQAPQITVTGENPSQLLDWKRFCSDLVLDFHKFQADIIRGICPGKFITHNMMGFADKVDYFKLAQDLEFCSHDQYPGGHFAPQEGRTPRIAAELDFIRGTKGRSFWIMEQQSGITGWGIMGRAPKPGQLGMWAMQTVAHGADAVVFFRWRVCAMGTEQYWHGILPHSGIPGRNYAELGAMIKKMRPLLAEVQGTVPKSQVGIVFSYDQEYAMELQPHHADLTYVGHLMGYYTALYNRNIAVDFLSDAGDFSAYPVLIAPLQYLMNPTLEAKYKAYVENGGHLVLTMRTGVKDDSNLCMTDRPLPGNLSEVVGLEIPEYDCLRDTEIKVLWDGVGYTGAKWSDIITLKGASPLAVFDSEFYAGAPAVTVHPYGKGLAYYVATEPTAGLMERLAGELIQKAGLRSLGSTPDGVEISHRRGQGKDYIFVLNHTDKPQTVSIPEIWKPYFDGQSGQLAPFAVDVYTAER